MTTHKHLKQLVRSRMAKTGESYSTARRQVLRQTVTPGSSQTTQDHFPGSIPAAAALRMLLAHAGVRNPKTKAPFSEAMVFGIAGGIGAGMFAFHYAKENFSSFYIAGRHLWQDHVAWAQGAAKRLGVRPLVKESSGLKLAEKYLRELLAGGRPALAWVDGYRIIGVLSVDNAAGTALIGEGANEARSMPLAELAATRARIKTYKNRLLALEPAGKTPVLTRLVRGGIAACVEGLTRGRMKNFTLEIFSAWADRLDGSKAADAWEKIFPPGPHFYTGLRSINEHIEHSGTGGGLCRPMFAEFLTEAGDLLGDRELARLAARYAALGTGWSALADAALPDQVPEFRETKALLAEKAEQTHCDSGGEAEQFACSKALGDFGTRMKQGFPLDAAQSTALRRELQQRVRELYQGEKAAVAELGEWVKDGER